MQTHCSLFNLNVKKGNLSIISTILLNIAKKVYQSAQSAAVDPKIIPYGSEIYIPRMGKVLEAVDTGSAVKSRTASKKLGRDNIVIDVFCASRADAMRRIKKYPMFMTIYVEKR